MADTWLGLDLGRMVDHSALAVVLRSLVITSEELPLRDHRGQAVYRFEIPQLKQYPRGTPYPEVIAHLRDVVLPQPWLGANPRLVVDAGGVGGGVVDLLLDARLPAAVIAVTLTGGAAVTRCRWPRSRAAHWHVAKTELVSAAQAAFQSGRVVIYPMPPDRDTGRDHAATLRTELRAFTVRQTRAANEIYTAPEGEHDDLLLAAALPIFLGQRREYGISADEAPTCDRTEAAAFARESEQVQTAETQALAKEAAERQTEQERSWRAAGNPHWWQNAARW